MSDLKEYKRQWALKNKERSREGFKIWYAANHEDQLEKARKRYQALTPEQKKQRAVDAQERIKRMTPEQRERHRQQGREKAARYAAKHSAKISAKRKTPEAKKYQREYQREWAAAHPEKRKEWWDRWFETMGREQKLQKLYGMSVPDYMSLLDKQGGLCALCGKPPKKNGRPLHIDHCHETGRVRGILCFTCNGSLGHLGDTVEALEKVMRYLRGSN